MVRNSKNNQNHAFNDAFDFIKRNWLIITGLLLVIPYLKRYFENQATKNIINTGDNFVKEAEAKAEVLKDIKLVENSNPLTQSQKRKAITTSSSLWSASASVAHDLGVKYKDAGHWWDFMNPRGWTENDEAARKTLVFQRNNFAILEKLYYEVDTNSRSLRADILEYLDKDELTYLRRYLKI
ncbi:MAG: hypothetical protein ABI441_13750 [Flavobacterium sp.]